VEPIEPLPVETATEATRRPRAKSSANVPALAVDQGTHSRASNARGLVQTAYEQLSARKRSIEMELARIDTLREEHEAVTAQVAALDEAMKAFQQQG
jgi:hypothetical protein